MAGPWEKYRTQQMPADPSFQYKGQKAALDVQGKQADIQNDAQRIALERERVGLARQAQGNSAQAQQRAAEIANREKDMGVSKLRALQNQIERVRELYQSGPGSTKGVSGLMDYLPTPQNKQFDVAGAGLAEIGLNAFRTPGVGSQSDRELKAFVEANRPSASDYDTQIEEKLRNLQNRLNEAYRPYGIKPPPIKNAPRKQSKAINFDDWKD